MTLPKTAAELFEVWLPNRFAEFLATPVGKTVKANEHCTIHIDAESGAWLLQVQSGQLVTKSSPADAPASFRLHIATNTLERFVLGELGSLPAVSADAPPPTALLKLLNLDDEALNLVQGIPGAMRIVVQDGSTQFSASVGPGSRPLTPAACTLRVNLADAELLRAGKAQPMDLFFGGRIQIEGDPQVAMGLAGLFL